MCELQNCGIRKGNMQSAGKSSDDDDDGEGSGKLGSRIQARRSDRIGKPAISLTTNSRIKILYS